MCDSTVNFTDDISYIPDENLPRTSCDNICNSRGLKVLDLYKATGFRIANGRYVNTDAYTFFNRNACSVIDFLLLKYTDFYTINSVEVLPFNAFSDHAP
jgi:hypothetical protein